MVDLLTREYEVNYSHIDNRGIAKPSFPWNIMQDAATVHAEALHIGPLDLRIVWVLSRMKARLTRPLRRMSGCGAKRGVQASRVQAGTAVSRSLWITSRLATHSLCG